MNWRCDLSSRVQALQVWKSEFKPQYGKKGRKGREREKWKVRGREGEREGEK
jgi:hypothetical protein